MIKYVKSYGGTSNVYTSNHILTNFHPMMIRIREGIGFDFNYYVYIINLKTHEQIHVCVVENLEIAKAMGKQYIKSKYGIVSNKEFRNKTFIES